MKYTLSFLVLMLPLLVTGQKSAMEDYFKNYFADLNNLGDVGLSMNNRNLFGAEIMDQYFLSSQESLVYNHLRPSGTQIIMAQEYLDIILTDFPEGVQFRFDSLEIIAFQLGNQYSEAKVHVTFQMIPNGESPKLYILSFLLHISGMTPNRISGRIKSIDRVADFVEELSFLETELEFISNMEPIVSAIDSQIISSLTAPINDPALINEEILQSDSSLTPHTPEAVTAIEPSMVLVKEGLLERRSKRNKPSVVKFYPLVVTEKINPYYIGKYEVTHEEFRRFVEATGYVSTAEERGTARIIRDWEWFMKKGINWRHDETGKLRSSSSERYPVLHVSWYDAIAYCNWLSSQHGFKQVYTLQQDSVEIDRWANGYRLPTKAEWEYAASERGGNKKWAGTSNEFSSPGYFNFRDKSCGLPFSRKLVDDGYPYSSPIGAFLPNELGFHDMSGNVAEWCMDAHKDKKDPEGKYRIIKGGSWSSDLDDLRWTSQSYAPPNQYHPTVGFRLCRNGE